jgi:hypothetical protein
LTWLGLLDGYKGAISLAKAGKRYHGVLEVFAGIDNEKLALCLDSKHYKKLPFTLIIKDRCLKHRNVPYKL